jgi:hypothetical protein
MPAVGNTPRGLGDSPTRCPRRRAYWFFGRPTVEELRQDLRAVLMKHHWDWDLSDPEVKAAWGRGEIDRLYPPELGWLPEAPDPAGRRT